MTTNEAAERLRDRLIEHAPAPMVDEYGAAERRATVERIRAALHPYERSGIVSYPASQRIARILDEEAGR